MQQIFPDNWSLILFGLIFSITCAQMLVVYVLADSSKPPAGLGLYTVYFMASLLGWIALTLQQNSDLQLAVNVPSVMIILNSYILFMAAGQRAAVVRGRIVLGAACLGACLCVFFLPPSRMFVVQTASAFLFFLATGLICAWRGWRYGNIGDAIIACAGLIMAVGMPIAIYFFTAKDLKADGEVIALGVHSAAYALVAIGFLASVLIEYQHHLSALATQDSLTRLHNRRGLEDALQLTLSQAARHGLVTSAIMVDLDHFKQINDSFGDEVGDHVLRQVAELINHQSRGSDIVSRIGGEEFLVILPDTPLDAACAVAERIRENIGLQPLQVDSQRIDLTVSLGVACAVGNVDLDQLSNEAARAMYLAKRGGRNRVASVEHRPVHLSTENRQV
ncbi:MAG: GGDEF domain-containing protein [Halioglobus sp.]|nr:GGDEF domain-containing protein [Halioglobus sp.]